MLLRSSSSPIACLVLLFLAAMPAPAQVPPAPPPPQAAQDTARVIELPPLSVTALRTPLRMEEVPYAVAVNTAAEIRRGKPGLSLEEALRAVPGVQVENRFNYALGERITIRGFGARAQFGVRGIRVFVDGVPATLPDGQTSLTHVDVKTLGRVEVIRGAAASLYGNTAGGVIHMETEVPAAESFAQQLAVTGGSHGLLRLQSSTGGRRGDAFYRLDVSRLGFEGYRQHGSARNLHLNARAGRDGELDRLRIGLVAGDSDALNPGSLSAAQREEDPFQAFRGNVQQRTGKTVREATLGASWVRYANAGELELAGYLAGRDVRNPIPSHVIEFSRGGAGARALFRARPAGRLALQWAAGAEADLQRDDRQNYVNAAGENGALTLDQLERVHNLGLFGQLSASPLARLTLLAGLRYDRFRFAADDRFTSGDSPDDSGRRRMSALSPSAGATFAVTRDFHLYGNAGTAFETPTTTELANRPSGAGGFNPELEPQRAISYEAGARARLGERAAVELAAYRIEIDNALIPFEVPDVPGRRFFRNAGTAARDGVEFGSTLVPLEALSVQVAYTYTRARFLDYAVGEQDFRGNRVPGIAPHRADLILRLAPGAGRWFAALEHRFVSRLAVNDANTAFSPRYLLSELRGGAEGLRLGALRLDPFAGVSNLFSVDHNAAVTVNAFGERFFEPGPARSLFVGGNVQLTARR